MKKIIILVLLILVASYFGCKTHNSTYYKKPSSHKNSVKLTNRYDTVCDYDSSYLNITNEVRAKYGKAPYIPNDTSFN